MFFQRFLHCQMLTGASGGYRLAEDPPRLYNDISPHPGLAGCANCTNARDQSRICPCGTNAPSFFTAGGWGREAGLALLPEYRDCIGTPMNSHFLGCPSLPVSLQGSEVIQYAKTLTANTQKSYYMRQMNNRAWKSTVYLSD